MCARFVCVQTQMQHQQDISPERFITLILILLFFQEQLTPSYTHTKIHLHYSLLSILHPSFSLALVSPLPLPASYWTICPVRLVVQLRSGQVCDGCAGLTLCICKQPLTFTG